MEIWSACKFMCHTTFQAITGLLTNRFNVLSEGLGNEDDNALPKDTTAMSGDFSSSHDVSIHCLYPLSHDNQVMECTKKNIVKLF